jgi:hypothetical protein
MSSSGSPESEVGILFIIFAFPSGGWSSTDDTYFFGALSKTYQNETILVGEADDDLPELSPRMILVIEDGGQWIVKNSQRFLKLTPCFDRLEAALASSHSSSTAP